jgi:hypothetical protein
MLENIIDEIQSLINDYIKEVNEQWKKTTLKGF